MKYLSLLLLFAFFFVSCEKDNNMSDTTSCENLDLTTFEDMEALLRGVWEVSYNPYIDNTAIVECKAKHTFVLSLDSIYSKLSDNTGKFLSMTGKSGSEFASGVIIVSQSNGVIMMQLLFSVGEEPNNTGFACNNCNYADCNNITGADYCGDYLFKKLR